MAAETLLITRTDILEYYHIGKNIPDSRLNPLILRAQQSDLKDFIGAAMYHELFESPSDPNIVALLDGVEFENSNNDTVFFGGLKQLLSVYSYRRLVQKDSVFVTRGGVKSKITEESEQETDGQINQEARNARGDAGRLEGEAWEYLDENRDKYPLWDQAPRKNQGLKAAFRITRL
jgi:hypothetical protein